ncbi:MAG: sigma-54 dependent transcriptional regulator [Thiohalomonadales bacterium]
MAESTTLLIVETDDIQRQVHLAILNFLGYKTCKLCDNEQLEKYLDNSQDVKQLETILLGHCGSTEILATTIQTIRKKSPEVPIVLMLTKEAASLDRETALKQCFTTVNLPLSYGEFSDALHRAQVFRSGKKRKGNNVNLDLFRSLVGNSRTITGVRKLIEQVADSEATVLILGESGTGKEVVARNLHYYSTRRDKPFVPINCGAIPGELLESELFGHEKGAFTGAISARRGRFELAEGGTLFLDEIGDMPMAMQVKLLRVLQERTFERVGGGTDISVDVRVVAATHRNLEEMIKEGTFREDLYYRLQVFPIEMPPLRARIDDIPLLINELITRLEHENRGSVRFSPPATLALCQYRWPGNVRELSNLLERMVVMHPYGVVDIADLPAKFRSQPDTPIDSIAFEQHFAPSEPLMALRLPRDGIDLKEHISSMECSLIVQALEEAGGVVAHAAKRLNMRRTTLVEKLRKYGLQRTETMTEA